MAVHVRRVRSKAPVGDIEVHDRDRPGIAGERDPVVFIQRAAQQILAAGHDTRRPHLQGGVLGVVEQHRKPRRVVTASVHHVVRVPFSVLVKPAVAPVPGLHGLDLFGPVHVIVAVEVQVEVRPED